MPPGARAPLIALLAALAAPGSARAQTPAPARARLVYFVDPMAAGCPTADEFRAAANARAGHELFGEPAGVTIDVTLRRLDPAVDPAYVATVGLPDATGSPAATRELRSEAGCAELATAAALVVSLALDPESILRVPPATAPAAPAPAPPAPASRSWRALVGAGPRGAWGMTPEPTAGLALSAAAVGERVSVGAELGGWLSNEARYSHGAVSVLPLTLSVLPCGLSAHWELCAVARLGLLRGTGTGFAEDFSTWKAFAAAGLRGGGFVDVGRIRFRASIEGTGVVPTTGFFVGETAVYTTRSVSVATGLDALLFFP